MGESGWLVLDLRLVWGILVGLSAVIALLSHGVAHADDPPCISVVGDSVAYGTLVVMIPGQGFATVRTEPLSHVLQRYFDDHEIEVMVYDRSVPASALSAQDDGGYAQSAQYQAVLTDNCAVVWLAPWVNELISGVETGPEPYLEAVGRLSEALRAQRPDVHLVLSGYYPMRPARFTDSYYGDGLKPETVIMFNQAIAEACATNRWGASVSCLMLSDVFEPDTYRHVYQRLRRARFMDTLYEPIPARSAGLFNFYWGRRPNGQLRLDGVHLNVEGKNVVVEAFAQDVKSRLQHRQPIQTEGWCRGLASQAESC